MARPAAGPSLPDPLGAVLGRLAACPLTGLRAAARLRYEVAANAGDGGDVDWEAGVQHRDGAHTFTATGTTTRLPFAGLSEAERTRHSGELVLPNLMESLSADPVAAFTVWPPAAGRTTVVCDFLFHPYEIARPDFDPSDAVTFWDLVNRLSSRAPRWAGTWPHAPVWTPNAEEANSS